MAHNLIAAVALLGLAAVLAYKFWWLRRPEPKGRYIGPWVPGTGMMSKGMPLRTSDVAHGLWGFKFPTKGQVHAVTWECGPLHGRIRARFRIDGAAQFYGQEGDKPGAVSLYFQRKGLKWTLGQYAGYRWYGPPVTIVRLAPGTFEIEATLDNPGVDNGDWRDAAGQMAYSNPASFDAAKANAERVGLVFGEWDGARAHGVYASNPATFTLIEWEHLP